MARSGLFDQTALPPHRRDFTSTTLSESWSSGFAGAMMPSDCDSLAWRAPVLPPELPLVSILRACALALIAGYVDCFALVHFRVFASFMSGNTTQAGLSAGSGSAIDLGRNLLPIPLFVLGVFLGTMWMHGRSGRRARGLLWATALLLAGGAATSTLPLPAWIGVVLLSLAMGLLNSTLTHVGGQSISLGYVTGTLNNLAQHLSLAARGSPVADARGAHDTHVRRAALLAGLWGAFFAGACLGGAAAPRWAAWALAPPIVLSLLFAAMDRRG
jgi:uncharacterized membrane protein YoaK (UPF0700 family)